MTHWQLDGGKFPDVHSWRSCAGLSSPALSAASELLPVDGQQRAHLSSPSSAGSFTCTLRRAVGLLSHSA